jgi:protein-disulfide isomerase
MKIIIKITIVLGLMLNFAYADFEQDSAKENVQENASEIAKVPTDLNQGLEIQEKDIVVGDPHSSVVIVEYFSPSCLHCHLYHKHHFPELFEKYIKTNKIAYVYREFVANKQDLDAALLARCGTTKEEYLKFIDVLFSTQDNWAFNKNHLEILTNIGVLGGVSPERYAKCLNDKDIINFLKENTMIPIKIKGFAGTPALFINGVRFSTDHSFSQLSQEIDRLLKK